MESFDLSEKISDVVERARFHIADIGQAVFRIVITKDEVFSTCGSLNDFELFSLEKRNSPTETNDPSAPARHE